MSSTGNVTKHISPLAQAGLIAKCFVYCLLGVLVIMAGFRVNGQAPSETDKEGVFDFVGKQVGGQIILGAIAVGLICYCTWRFIQAFADTENKGKDAEGIVQRGRYIFSGLVYAALTVFLVRRLLFHTGGGGNSKQNLTQAILEKPLGQWIVGIVALGIASVGIYQIYYGLSEKYKNHVQKSVTIKQQKLLLSSGKIGYVARGLVWMILGWIFLKAAYQSNSSKAGGSAEAFQFLSQVAYGSFLLAGLGVGLISYGIFNFVRARYENFQN